jgi:hypothetical protein
MVFRNIQCGEIMEVVLDLRTLTDGKTGSAKDRFYALLGQGNRMQAAGMLTPTWQAHIDGIGCQRSTKCVSLKRRTMQIQFCFQRISGRIDHLTCGTPLGIRQGTELLEQRSQFAFFAQVTDTHGIQQREITRSGKFRSGTGQQRLDVMHGN